MPQEGECDENYVTGVTPRAGVPTLVGVLDYAGWRGLFRAFASDLSARLGLISMCGGTLRVTGWSV